MKLAQDKPVIVFPADTPGRPSFLRTQKARFENPPGKIGEFQSGWLCSRAGNVIWSEKVYKVFSPTLPRAFRDELQKANYPVPMASDAIFDVPKDKEQDKDKGLRQLHVGMLVKDVQANLCNKGSDGLIGGVYMKIFWQVYAPDAQKVVFETTTEGTWQLPEPAKATVGPFFTNAFAMATRNLLAEPGFRDAVANTVLVEAKPVAVEALKITGGKPTGEPLANNVTMLRSAVATVVTDTGTGSGFFLSTEGHVMTNYHVVRETKFVKVRLPTGRDLLGEVIRVDKARDVALIKTEAAGVQPIPARSGEANIGEEVYAIGSPLGDRFNTTLTRGILSGYRNIAENRYLQSDVAILPGNSGGPLLDGHGAVLGITVAGLGAKGLAGMNFFIPINDALARLGIELK